MENTELKKAIDRMIEIKAKQKDLDAEYGTLQAQVQIIGEAALENTKRKSVSYFGSKGKLTVTLADKVGNTLPALFSDMFGKAYSDLVNKKEVIELTAEGKRIMAAIWNGEYCKGSVEDIVMNLNCDEKAKKSLMKKLNGKNYETDKKNLMKLGGLDEGSAGDYAYMVSEIINWNKIQLIIKLNNNGEFTQAALDEFILNCNSAVCVEQSTKITVEELAAS